LALPIFSDSKDITERVWSVSGVWKEEGRGKRRWRLGADGKYVRDAKGGDTQKTIATPSVMDVGELDMWQPTVLEKTSPKRRRKEKHLPD
jgi:hypothetical protein